MTLDKCVIWKSSDGTIKITKFLKSAQLQSGLTEDQFIQQQINRLKKDTNFGNAPCFLKTKLEVSSFFSGVHKDDHDRVKIDNQGNLSVDPNFTPKHVLLKNKKTALKNKLKNTLQLSDEELDLLIQ